MNKQQIKAELRRSACEDKNPWHGVSSGAHEECFVNWCAHHHNLWENMFEMENEDCRTFFLLVAEAL